MIIEGVLIWNYRTLTITLASSKQPAQGPSEHKSDRGKGPAKGAAYILWTQSEELLAYHHGWEMA